MSDDDEAVMKRLAALEIEVKAKTDADRSRKEAALAKVREQRAKQTAERDSLRSRQAEIVVPKKKKPAAREVVEDDDDDGGLGSTLALAKKASGVRKELAKTPKAGEKSWITSGVASLLLGPLGWLYAGSLRESIPASAAWLAFGAIASKIIPLFLLMPVLMVAMPLSGIAGVMYAIHYNRKGGRQRLFDRDKAKKQLPPGG